MLCLSSRGSRWVAGFSPQRHIRHASALFPPHRLTAFVTTHLHCCRRRDLPSRLIYPSIVHTRTTLLDKNPRLQSTSTSHDGADPVNHFLLEGLNQAQVEAVTQPCLSITRVVAGPGAGKTRVLTSRIAYLLHHDPHHRILAVTFTKKAASEMQSRLQKLMEATEMGVDADSARASDSRRQDDGTSSSFSPLDRVTLGTFHSVCAKILRWNGNLLGSLPSVIRDTVGCVNATALDGSFAIVDQSEQLRILRECEKEMDVDLKSRDVKPLTILNAIGNIKGKLAMGEDPMKPPGRKAPSKAIREGMRFFPLYRQKLLSRNSLDFDDLILMTRELLQAHEDVRDRLCRRWHHVLVDEFQDTSRTQLDLVKLLSDSSLFVVGDADQSIYSWRGAHVESMSDFCHEFDDRLDGVRTVYLMENYRSTTNIVSAAQKVISADSSTSTKQDDLRQDMKPMRGSGPTPRILACADGKAEAGFVVKTVQDMVASGDFTPDSSVAVIYRTNAQSRAVEEACVQANLPYVVRGASGSFYKRAEIKDCLCFLRLLYNGRDESALVRAVKTPSRGIGDVAMEEFRSYCAQVDAFYESCYPDLRKPTPFEMLLELPGSNDSQQNLVHDIPAPDAVMSKRALNRFVPFAMQMRRVQRKAYSETVAGLLSSIVEELELKAHFDTISKSAAEFSDRWTNVLELRQAAERYSADGPSLNRTLSNSQQGEFVDSPLSNFLDDVALVTDMADDSLDDVEGAERRMVVNLMTIHASKGQEFDAVILLGNEEGTLPTRQAILEGEGSVALDEEKRLCYVAMTRAKTNLVLTWRKEVTVFNGNSLSSLNAKRSRFLNVLVSKKERKTGKDKVGAKTSSDSARNSLPSAGLRPRSSSKATRRNGVKTRTPSVTRPTQKSPVEYPKPRNHIQRHSRESVSWRKGTHGRTKPRPKVAALAVQRSSPTNQQIANGSTAQPSSSKRNRAERMDSTWFYPVGSSVVHTQLGSGRVLPPPQTGDGEMLVRVQFGNGKQLDFPADGKDLQRDFTS